VKALRDWMVERQDSSQSGGVGGAAVVVMTVDTGKGFGVVGPRMVVTACVKHKYLYFDDIVLQ